ncbi:uncharacterized protein LOC129732670 [Wyeomyia smithii]|uniref:uncharacterized protein LOC129732670 n=1 Tax=Wyeomyia smithii TaxID=174621 RepID=UPI002467DDEE|nr:uncharacterized protein LOC129732670 [Wyeomyia smithii]
MPATTAPSDHLNINELPSELLENILDYLPLSDRKRASLVCQLWCNLAMSQRAMKNVALRIGSDSLMYNAKLLQNSWRPYRVLQIYLTHRLSIENDDTNILAVLNKFGPTLEEFSLNASCTTNVMAKILWKLPQLRTLDIFICDWFKSVEKHHFPILQNLHTLRLINGGFGDLEIDIVQWAPNARNLQLNASIYTDEERWFHALDSYKPHLKSLNISYRTWHKIPLNRLTLPQLEKLEIDHYTYGDLLGLTNVFPTSAPVLTTIRLNFKITHQILHTISERWPHLQELMFILPDVSDNNMLRPLEEFKHLRKLHIQGFVTANILEQLKALPTVQEFVLSLEPTVDAIGLAYNLSLLLPNVQTLNISDIGQHGNEFLRGICEYFTSLRRLDVNNLAHNDEYNMDAFNRLGLLIHLEELSLQRMKIRLGALPPNNLRRLKLSRVVLLDMRISSNLANIFPKLQFLGITGILQRHIEPIRQQFVGCVIHCE